MTKQEITELQKLVWSYPIEEILGYIVIESDTKTNVQNENFDINFMSLNALNSLTLDIERVKLMNERQS